MRTGFKTPQIIHAFLMRVSGLCHYGLHLRIELVPFIAFRTQIIHAFQCGYVDDVIMEYISESSQFRSLPLEPKQLQLLEDGIWVQVSRLFTLSVRAFYVFFKK